MHVVILTVKDHQYKFEKVNLKIKFKIPFNHTSVITKSGKAFLFGGSDARLTKERLNSAYILNEEGDNLFQMTDMLYKRSGAAACCVGVKIFIIGGFVEELGYSRKCEYFDRKCYEWVEMEESNEISYMSAVCNVNNKYIYKFGGFKDTNTPNNAIERYNIAHGAWENVEFKTNIPMDMVLPTCASCEEINHSQILIMGGLLQNAEYSYDTMVLDIDEDGQAKHVLKNKSKMRLPFEQAFSNPQAIIHQGKLFVLQNVLIPSLDTSLKIDQRRLLCFTGFGWEVYAG